MFLDLHEGILGLFAEAQEGHSSRTEAATEGRLIWRNDRRNERRRRRYAATASERTVSRTRPLPGWKAFSVEERLVRRNELRRERYAACEKPSDEEKAGARAVAKARLRRIDEELRAARARRKLS